MENIKFITCNSKDGEPGFCVVENNLVTYIGHEPKGWWYWTVIIDEEDLNEDFLSHLMETSDKYQDRGFSEGFFKNFVECINAVGFYIF